MSSISLDLSVIQTLDLYSKEKTDSKDAFDIGLARELKYKINTMRRGVPS